MLILEAPSLGAGEHIDQIEILLVEDNPIDAEMTIRTLQKHKLLNALQWVKDGQAALDFLFCEGAYAYRKGMEPPGLILLDIKMPKVNGMEVLQRIKADAKLRLVPVVIMSSSSEHPDIAEACRLGVNSYIVKSIDFGAFTEMVAKVTNRYIPRLIGRNPVPSRQSYPAKDEDLSYNAAM